LIRTNLSTKPFYNVRAVHTALVAVALLVVGLTALNVTRLVALSREYSESSARANRDEERANSLRASADGIRRNINPDDFKALTDATREANALIDRRVFSWTELFNRFEDTLPPDVRIASVRPKIEKDGRVLLSLTVVGRRVEAIDHFIESMESTGAFSDVLSREETADADGLLQTTLEGEYHPKRATAAVAPAGQP
jgi:hypothetical protein